MSPKPKQTNARAAVALIAVVAALALAACGGDGGGDPTAATGAATPAEPVDEQPPAGGSEDSSPRTAVIRADPSGALAYLHDDAEAKAGAVTIELDNPSDVVHDVTVEGEGGRLGATDRVTAGDAATELELDPGTYTFYCSVTGHRAAGMEGTLTVE